MESARVAGREVPRGIARVTGPVMSVLGPKSSIPIALLLALLLGLGDFVTGVEFAFTLLYLLPIAIATWYRGRLFALLVAALCASLAALTEAHTRLHHGWPLRPVTLVWNHGSTLAAFVLVILLLSRLRQFISREIDERRIAVEQLRHADRLNAVGKLAAGVAHELGTPLNVILGSAELIEEDPTGSGEIRRLSGIIRKQTERMAGIIRQLLDFSRKGGTAAMPLDLGRLASDVAALLTPLARKQGIEIRVEPGPTISVLGNRQELEQVLNNLVMNAIQSMPNGGEVRLRYGSRAESDPFGRSRFVASLAIIDEGSGIAPNDLDRVFDPFFTTKDVGRGTGLGLSVSYGIIRDHDGSIGVESRLDAGSTFTVRLPVVAP